MHDIVELEDDGVPGVFVASDQFVTGAQAQSVALGADPAAVYVPHPIQDRTDDEIAALADRAFDAVVGALCQPAQTD